MCVIIKYNLPQYLFHSIRYSSDVILHFHHLRCFDTVFRKPYQYFSIALKVILHRWRILPSFVQMPAPKNLTRFHYQDAIYLPPAQSLAMVLGVFNLIIKNSETKEERKRKKKKLIIMFCLPITPCSCSFHYSSLRPRTAPCRTLRKPAHEGT